VHCGYEASAVTDTFAHPIRALGVALRGVRTQGEFAPDIALDRQRPAQYMFSQHVDQKLEEIRRTKREPHLTPAE
jgi:hypothetical protein